MAGVTKVIAVWEVKAQWEMAQQIVTANPLNHINSYPKVLKAEFHIAAH